MAVQQVEAFYKKVMEDDVLKEKVMGIKGAPLSVAEKVVAIAKENGFDVSVEDFKEDYTEQADLSAEEMEQVSGGLGWSECLHQDPNCSKSCVEICGTFLGHYIGKQR